MTHSVLLVLVVLFNTAQPSPPLSTLAQDSCEIVWFSTSDWHCPQPGGCPPLAGCNRTVYRTSGGDVVVACRCGTSGPIPYCCHLVVRADNQNLSADGSCSASICPVGFDCVEQMGPDGMWYAECLN